MRQVEVIIGRQTVGQGLRVASPFRIVFEITKTAGRTPNALKLMLYNLSQANEGRIKGEFDEVLINAGYQDSALLLYRGNIRYVTSYPRGTDRILEIDGGDGDRDFKNAIVNTTLAAGSSNQQLLDHIEGTFTTTKLGHAVVKDRRRIRGKVISRMAREVLDDLALESDAHWSIQDGRLDIVPVESTLPTEAIVINRDTGMLSSPEVDNVGIKVSCLLNPRIKVNGKIKIDNNGVRLRLAKARASKPGAQPSESHHTAHKPAKGLARLDPDGIYKVYKAVFKGDNRGGEWRTDVYAVALDKRIPAGKQAA
jgi:hypothetical protein